MQGIFSRYKSPLMMVLVCLCFIQGKSQQVGISVTPNGTALQVTVRQEINFGALTQGQSGGSIIISPEGTRTSSGTVVPLNFGSTYLPLILEIEGPKGSIVSMLSNEITTLTGSNGGIMKLKMKGSNPIMPFYITDDAPAKSIIKIGAELIVGSSIESPPGNYSGTINISFVAE